MGDGGSVSGGDGKTSGGGSAGGSNFDCYIGSLISLTSKSGIRYEGVLYTIDAEKCNIALAGVRSFGTEGRKKDGPQIPPTDKVYDYIIFRGSDIKDLQVKSSPQAQAQQPYTDPAIIAQSQQSDQQQPQRVPSTPTYPGGMNSWTQRPLPPPVVNGPMPMGGAMGGTMPMGGTNGPMPMGGANGPMSMGGANGPMSMGGANGPMSMGGAISMGGANGPMPMGSNGPLPMGSWGLPRPPPPPVGNGGLPPMYWPGYYTPSPPYLGVPNPEPLLQPPAEPLLQKPDLSKNLQFFQPGYPPQQAMSPPGTSTSVTPKLTRLPSASQMVIPTMDLPVETTDVPVPEALDNFQQIPEMVKESVVVSPQQHPQASSPSPPAAPVREYQRDYPEREGPRNVGREDGRGYHQPRGGGREYHGRREGRDYQPRGDTREYQGPNQWRGNGRRNRGRGGGIHHRSQNFTEDFDFTAMNEKFNKDEVWGELGSRKSEPRSDDDETPWPEDPSSNSKKPVYCKDDFFDSLSCDALDRAVHADRPRFSEQRKINTETFGDTFLRSRGRGYRGGYRGGQGYRGRGRQQGNPPQTTPPPS